MTVLVTGARGRIGSAVLAELVADGSRPLRVSSRRPGAGAVPDGVDAVRADLADPSTFPSLFRGVQKVFLYAVPDRIEELMASAASAGVEHIVLLSSSSVLFPNASRNPRAVEHLRVEEAVRRSGVGWTFVRTGALAANTLRWADDVRTRRTVRTAFPDTATSFVHERDAGGVAARLLVEGGHDGEALLVPGGEPVTEREQVDAIAEAIGEPVALELIDLETYRDELRQRLPERVVDTFVRYATEPPQVPAADLIDAVPAVLGRPALTFGRWASDHADDFR